MSPAAAYRFFPWVSRGVAHGIAAVDTGGVLPGRVRLDVGVEVTGGGLAEIVLDVQGPGDVAGIDPRQIVRTEPVPDSTDFEPNFFPHLELADAALPWLFTPAAPDPGTDRLRPWCVLVVVAAQEGVSVGPGKLLDVLEIRPPADPRTELPDLAESWAWVHAEVVVEEGASPQEGLAGDERLSVARLLCPRRLDPLTSYHACLVPAFDAGVAAGLGEPVADGAQLGPAWRAGAAAPPQIRLPVYHHWQFATGPVGDFEALVRRLRPAAVPEGVGRRPLYIGAAGSGLPQLAPDDDGAIVDLEGALQPVDQERHGIPQPLREAIADTLARLAGAQRSHGEDPQAPPLGAPLYGGWPAQRHTVDADSDPPPWLRQLNTDPRDRAAAAAGVRAVQMRQEDLIHAAWEQLGAAQTANRRLREIGLARAVAGSLHRRHLAAMAPGALLQVMGPSSSRLRVAERTLAAETRASVLGLAAIQPAFRRAVRPTTRVRRSGSAAAARRADVVDRLNSRTLERVPQRSAPDGAVLATGMRRLRVEGALAVVPGADGVKAPKAFAGVLAELAGVSTKPGRPPKTPSGIFLAREVDVLAIVAVGASALMTVGGRPQLVVDEARVHRLPTFSVAAQAFDRVVRGQTKAGLPTDPLLSRPMGSPHPQARFRWFQAMRGTDPDRLFPTVAADPRGPSLQLEAVGAAALEATQPARRAELRATARIAIPSGIRRAADPLAPIRGAPVFPVPLVELIAAADPEYVLPGLHRLEANTVGLVEANHRFVVAALAGANHEMARELAWRLYPVERRATFFRRFWERPPGLVDTPPMDDWRADGELRDQAVQFSAGEVILVIRGDLLRRYPGTIVYAAKAEFAGGRRVLVDPPVEVHPVLSAALPPDVTMRGFPLSVEQVVGEAAGDNPSAGWFFILAAQPTEPRFGLDVAEKDPLPPTSRADLNWGHMAAGGDLAAVSHAIVDALVDPVLGPLTWGRDAAQQAAITLQDPVRIVVHARHLLGASDA